MHDNIRQETFRDLVNNPAIFAVARKIITENYIECAEEHEDEMRILLDQAFDRLAACGQDEQAFQSAITYLNTRLFKKQDPDFWFNQVYLRYKRAIKPGLRYTKMQEWILGQRVLDLGCGDGLTGLEIARHGYRVIWPMCSITGMRLPETFLSGRCPTPVLSPIRSRVLILLS